MKRKIYGQLLEWKNRDKGSSAVLIDGARRVGKSYIAEEFGRREYKSYVLIDFAKGENRVKDLFREYLGDLDTFFAYLEVAKGVKLHRRESLIIFDEIEYFPKAREAIKHFVADGRYDYIETGSLVSIAENVKDILIPSEELDMAMYPMDFEEFLWAKGREDLMPMVRECFLHRRPLGPLHRMTMDLFREYMIVGGMPQVVEKYVKTRDFSVADMEKRKILSLYRKGIKKHAGVHALRVERIFDEIPAQLSKHEKKFTFSAFGKDARLREYEDAVMWLADAMVVNVACNATEPNVGLALSKDSSAIKCYFLDTGLLVSHAFSTSSLTAEDVHRHILFDDLEFNEGMFAENVVSQQIAATGAPLYFFSRNERGNRAESMEIDFLASRSKLVAKSNVIPIEVKCGRRLSHKSLDKFRGKYGEWLSTPYLLSAHDVKMDDGIVYLPLYMAGLVGTPV